MKPVQFPIKNSRNSIFPGCEPLTSPTDNAACIKKLPEFVEFIAETQPDYAFMFTR